MGSKGYKTASIEKWDRVTATYPNGATIKGIVVQDGGSKSLIEYFDGTTRRDWFDNSQLLVYERRRSRVVGNEPDGLTINEAV